MYLHVVRGEVSEPSFLDLVDRWPSEVRPGAKGYLGAVWGVTDDRRALLAVRFEPEEAAVFNNLRPAHLAWRDRLGPLTTAVSVHGCRRVDTLLGGGADRAGFVQIAEGQVADEEEARRRLHDIERRMGELRPEMLGITYGWHGAGGSFTKLGYFRSEADARRSEAANRDHPVFEEYRSLFADEPTYLDLRDPRFD